MATIQDVADRAGVSIATVSHVLNNTRFVSDETRAVVLEAIQELNYHPSAAARSLSSRKTQTVGMVISDITNIFFGRMIQGVLDVITPQDYNLILCTTGDIAAKEEEYFQLLFGRAVDGVIAAAASQKWSTFQLVETGQIPIVFIDRTFEGLKGPFVGVDNERGAYEANIHLVRNGHQRIGLVAGKAGMSSMEERFDGYKRALTESSIQFDPDLVVFGALTVDGGREAALRLLNRPDPPTAIFSNNNQLTLGVLLAFQEMNYNCPDDISLACFDDHPWSVVASPALTCVRQPDYEIGRVAANLLLEMLAGESIVADRVILSPELVVRQSCHVRTA